MDKITDFFANTQISGPIDILINVLLCALFAGVIAIVYINFGKGVSNRRQFASSFLLITVCTALIISLIKSSIALSLGLVGALSIVRFRTAIKEPEELTYLFFCIAIGLGFGANERLITISAGLVIVLILIIRGFMNKEKVDNSYNLSIKSSILSLDDIIKILKKHSTEINFKRLEREKEKCEVLISINLKDYKKLEVCIGDITKADEAAKVNFLANNY